MTFILSAAPMMDYTDRHFRYLLRLISPHARLYTEMITAQALQFGDRDKLLKFNTIEKYVALQLGGSDPISLKNAAKLGEDFGYDEINLNVGCPSPRVKKGRFGACLMLEPQLVADCVAAMQTYVKIPVTVKCRIGVDEQNEYETLFDFIKTVSSAGCQTFIIHARKGWLSGLSPKENREIPPLNYEIVRQIKKTFPHLTIILNGGIKTLSDIEIAKEGIDGVMIGRAVCNHPYFLAEIEKHYFETQPLTRFDIIKKYIPYAQEQLTDGIKLSAMTRHLLGLFHGEMNGGKWRRYLSEYSHQQNNVEFFDHAMKVFLEVNSSIK